MVKLGTRENYIFFCFRCGKLDPDKQSMRFVAKDARILIFNCGLCSSKFVVTVMKGEKENDG